jgi:hypothetical protein
MFESGERSNRGKELSMKRLISMAFLIFAVSIATLAQVQDTGDRLTVNFSDPSRPGLVRVSLLNGSIAVRTHSGREVIIQGSAVARRRQFPQQTPDGLQRIDQNGPGLVVEEENNVMTVSNQSWTSGGNIEIQVPARTNLNLRAVNGGAIVVEGVEGEIEVTNVNGNVMLRDVSGSVVAHATNGRLTAVLKDIVANKPMSFTSMNANVDVTLPANAKANLRIRTDNGAAYSDFEIQLTRNGAPDVEDRPGGGRRIRTDRTINGTINGGGPDFELRTLNGNIYLRKAK